MPGTTTAAQPPARGVWPLPVASDGRLPRVSDGFHSRADKAAGRSRRVHRGHDIMYRSAKANVPPTHPWQSKWYEIPPLVYTPVLAAWPGSVIAAGILPTGGVVFLDHGHGIGTAYHHLRGVLVGDELLVSEQPHLARSSCERRGTPAIGIGGVVPAGHLIGIVGGSPIGYGLVHLHFDVVTGLSPKLSTLERGRLAGRFIDASEYLAVWQVTTHEVAQAALGDIVWRPTGEAA